MLHGKWRVIGLFLLVGAARSGLAEVGYNAFEYLDHLEAGQYGQLEAALTGLQESYERGDHDDRSVAGAFYVFSNSNGAYEAKLSEWVDAMPESYAARLARGIHYTGLGFLSRGAKFSSKTADSRMADMRAWFEKGARDLNAALSLNPRLTVAYRHLLRISMAVGNRQEIERLFHRGMEADPGSYAVWNGYLFTLQPKWGGSTTALGSAIREMEKRIGDNPALEALTGYLAYTLGNESGVMEDNEHGALYYYNKAVDKGEHYWFIRDRGIALYRLSRYAEAIKDFDRVLSIRPYDDEAYYWRGKAYRASDDNEAAMNDLNKAVVLDYSDPDIRRNRGLLHWELKQWDRAIADFSEALTYGGDDARHWAYRGRMYKKKKLYRKALDDFREAVRLEPENEGYWYRLSTAQYFLRDCGMKDSLNRYFDLCEDRDCDSDKLSWGRKTLSHLEQRGICT